MYSELWLQMIKLPITIFLTRMFEIFQTRLHALLILTQNTSFDSAVQKHIFDFLSTAVQFVLLN